MRDTQNDELLVLMHPHSLESDRIEKSNKSEKLDPRRDVTEHAEAVEAEVLSTGKQPALSVASSNTQMSSAFAAGAQVMSILPQIAGWGVGLSCFAYVAGQRELSSYLGKLGAPWAMALLSPTQLMQAGTAPATTVVLFGFIAFKFLLGGTTERRLQQWTAGLLGIGVLLLGASFFDQSAASKLRWVYGWTTCALIGGGVTVGELVASLRRTKEWGLHQVSLLDVIVLTGLVGTSSILGDARADADAVRGTSRLPIVSLVGKDTQPWRLVLSNGDKLLLMTPGATKAERQFKVIGVSEVDAVMGTEYSPMERGNN